MKNIKLKKTAIFLALMCLTACSAAPSEESDTNDNADTALTTTVTTAVETAAETEDTETDNEISLQTESAAETQMAESDEIDVTDENEYSEIEIYIEPGEIFEDSTDFSDAEGDNGVSPREMTAERGNYQNPEDYEDQLIAINIDDCYLSYSIANDNIEYCEDISNEEILYFKGVNEGADTLVIGEMLNGSVSMTTYYIVIYDDLTLEVKNIDREGDAKPYPIAEDDGISLLM